MAKLRPRDRHRAVGRLWPDEAPSLQPLRMSLWPPASHTRTPLGIGIIAAWPASALIDQCREPSTAPLIRIRPPVANSTSIALQARFTILSWPVTGLFSLNFALLFLRFILP